MSAESSTDCPSVVDAGGDALRAVLQGAERGVVECVDDEFAHGRNVAGGGGDEMVIAGVGEDGVGVAAVVRVGFASDLAPFLQAGDQV